MAQPQLIRSQTYTEPPAYLAEVLNDAERMLKYASETGYDVEEEVREHVLQARAAHTNGWDEATASNLLSALSKLAAQLKPITALSLKSYNSKPTRREYFVFSVVLTVLIVGFSIASFVATALSTAMKADIATANDLAVKLVAQVGGPVKANANPADPRDAIVIGELQQYASVIRKLDSEALQLRWLLLERDPFRARRSDYKWYHQEFEIDYPLTDLTKAAGLRTQAYQDVRYFAESLVDDVGVFYGAIGACLLPVLYALLGTCAYLLRNFQKQIALRTYTTSVGDSPRFFIAVIAGAVIGLFSNFVIGQGLSVSPLAIAFLVGYAVDVFFAFLEGLIQRFPRSDGSSSAPTSPSQKPATTGKA